MSRPLLEIAEISRSFGEVKAVDRLSFTMEAGQVYGFIGPNGAGKTTTMRILATLDLPDRGKAYIDGRDILAEPRQVRERMGFMADRFQAYPNLSVGEYLDFFARAYGLRGKERKSRVEEVGDFCGLVPLWDRYSDKLSKGMGQRLHLAKTLLHDPALLILDEPAAGLDPRARVELRALVQELARAGKGVLISSHILSELGEICDGVIIIEGGVKVTSGGMEEISRQVDHLSPVRVKIVSDAEAALRFFALQPLVEEAQVEAAGRENGEIRFAYGGDDEEMADLLTRAVRNGLRICEFRRSRAGLEEIFMETTKGRVQ